MKALRYSLLPLFLVMAVTGSARGQVARTNSAAPQIFRARVEPHWFGDTNRFWYDLRIGRERHEFVLVDAPRGLRTPAFDHERVARALTAQSGREVPADALPVDSLDFSADGTSVELRGKTNAWRCDLATYQLTDLPPATNAPAAKAGAAESPAIRSPDGQWEVLVRDHNLFLRAVADGKVSALTFDANPTSTYARDAQADRAVGMEYDKRDPDVPTPEIYWSPDSRRFVAIRTRPGTQRTVYLVESSPADQLQPRLQSYPYLKPGDEIPLRKPHLFEVGARREIPLDDALFPNPWSLDQVLWAPDASRFTFLYNQRGHQVLRLLAVDAASGAVRPLVDEQASTFIDYSGKFFAESLDASGEIIWMSERDGWNHLYLYDAQTGRVKNQITKGEWVVRSVERVDAAARQLWFRAGGLRPGEDPYHVHYARVNFDGTGLTILTAGDGQHEVKPSPDRRFFLDTWSRADLPPVTELRRSADGSLVCELERADIRELSASNWRVPERFVAKGRDGVTDIYGIIHRPRDFDPRKKYPVIENIYAGPHDAHVPKSFRVPGHEQQLADRGFIVVQIDGMGTSNRSKKFHDVCWKNLGDAGFPDRIRWLQAAAAQHPELDLARVGLYGTSAGGQNALGGLLTHGDFYKVGVADCGCHDNRMDKIWWNEQWMGWPVGPHYDAQSNVTLAHQLQGKLLLLVGELDKNVDPASTRQVVNALIRADKNFEFLEVPGAGHGVARTPYGWRRIEEFFVRHLLGGAP